MREREKREKRERERRQSGTDRVNEIKRKLDGAKDGTEGKASRDGAKTDVWRESRTERSAFQTRCRCQSPIRALPQTQAAL